ncbi:MAG TPA: hypothetical protein OIL95_13720 [Coprobacillaceae bacterium]|uniref:helix-turn-helix domain-containing protein n=1 Tax=Faecalibacillus faecis TaxID=1982628 RepID=UPI0035209B67|nr:hypothetical protein [Coprobacillaceae bacterium]
MSVEQELKQLMIAKSSSVRQFAIDVELPYTTIMSMLNKGIGNAGVNKIIKICDYLKIDVDALAEGRIEEKMSYNSNLSYSEQEHIEKYRSLNKDGKEVVDIILEREYQFLEYRKKIEDIKGSEK